MGRKRKKPGYDANKIMTMFFSAVSECYTNEDLEKRSIRKVADEFGITHLKARKILITNGVYSTDTSDEIRKLKIEGKSIKEIMEVTSLSRASVHSYLPYSKIIYNAQELSANAERIRKYRERQQILKRIETSINDDHYDLYNTVWQAIIKFEGYPFYTDKNSKFSYAVSGEEIYIKNRKISINRESVNKKLVNIMKTGTIVANIGELVVPAEKYLCSIFKHFGIV